VGDLSTEVRWPVREASRARISTGEGRGDDSWALQPDKTFGALQPAGARKKRKKVVKTIVPQALVEYMILNPHNPFVDFLEDNQGKTPTIQRSPTTRTAPRRTTVPMTRTTRSGIYVQDPAVRGSVDAVYTLEETSGTDVRRSLSLNPFANVR